MATHSNHTSKKKKKFGQERSLVILRKTEEKNPNSMTTEIKQGKGGFNIGEGVPSLPSGEFQWRRRGSKTGRSMSPTARAKYEARRAGTYQVNQDNQWLRMMLNDTKGKTYQGWNESDLGVCLDPPVTSPWQCAQRLANKHGGSKYASVNAMLTWQLYQNAKATASGARQLLTALGQSERGSLDDLLAGYKQAPNRRRV